MLAGGGERRRIAGRVLALDERARLYEPAAHALARHGRRYIVAAPAASVRAAAAQRLDV